MSPKQWVITRVTTDYGWLRPGLHLASGALITSSSFLPQEARFGGHTIQSPYYKPFVGFATNSVGSDPHLKESSLENAVL